MLKKLVNIFFSALLGIATIIVVTAPLIYSILAFVVGMVLLVWKVLKFDERTHRLSKN
ncbi:hypothetical protein [Companilactobacillus bobalius]|uniref:Uncharacterized protein n=2 Tax=Companilactobacillus bobalius TaxID=2801451 RepID=A0A202FCV5_9LACO|nr:hypothetical protein [Companilactobacillus bobalius]KRK82584.1 hypothetical protein FC78_GL002595 [Companilactobacillus bobalius DSM 19674]OVE98290.1 hypothetical protein LKACC16343_01177 [Companilactobacillus bobalius]GEO57668.1 hypothetical protein LBO01_07970 [Companilactobacillus paralimentarius]